MNPACSYCCSVPCAAQSCTLCRSVLHTVPLSPAHCAAQSCTLCRSVLHTVPLSPAHCAAQSCTLCRSVLHTVPLSPAHCAAQSCTLCRSVLHTVPLSPAHCAAQSCTLQQTLCRGDLLVHVGMLQGTLSAWPLKHNGLFPSCLCSAPSHFQREESFTMATITVTMVIVMVV